MFRNITTPQDRKKIIIYRSLHKYVSLHLNTLRPRQNGRHFADDILKDILLNENVWIPIKFSLKFVPKGPINNIPALVQIMAWRRPGDKPLSGPMMVNLLTHICVTRPQWVNVYANDPSGHIRSIYRKCVHLVHYVCPNVSEVTLKDIDRTDPYPSTTKHAITLTSQWAG